MSKLQSKLTIKSVTAGVALAAFIATTGVSAAGNVHVLDDAIEDYRGGDTVSATTSTYGTEHSKTAVVLEEDYYDYIPRSLDDLEEAEFAAFEVPEDLKVHD